MRNIATCVCVCTVVGVFRDRVGDVFDCVAVLVGVSRRRRQRAIAQTTHIDAFDGERTIAVIGHCVRVRAGRRRHNLMAVRVLSPRQR